MGVHLVNPAGTVLAQDTTIDNPQSSALRLYKNAGSTLNMTVQRVAMKNNDATDGEDGFQLEVEGSGVANILVDDSDFLNNQRSGIDALVEQNAGAVLNLTVQSSLFDNNGGLPSAVNFVTGGSATGRVKLFNNTMSNGGSTAMNVVSINTSKLDATISQNTVTNPGIGGGLRVQAEDDSTIKALVNDNNISVNPSRLPMEFRTAALANGDTASLDLTLEGNTVNGVDTAFVPGALMEMASYPGGVTTTAMSMCVNLATSQGAGGNTVNGTPGVDVFAYTLRQRTGTTYELQGLPAATSSVAVIQAHVAGNNPGGSLAGATFVAGPGGTTIVNYTPGTCSAPTTPTLPS
ncbi:MAG: hypothetical protein M3144_04830 [Actinomycetota bacterium]|nr:hypothetical protein [Actinomycetota bacterium]